MGCTDLMVLLYLLLLFFLSYVTASVTYDHKALVINGTRRILISGSIHYPRSTPEMWPDLIQKAKDGGIDVIQTYVFWNGHEPSEGKYYFEGNYDLVRFIKLVKQAGLYVHLRIGPYVCAEWNFGGFPVWLKFVPGISFRTDNGPFKAAMQKFTTKIVDMMKAERLFETQGGPIILSQIENEYGPVEYEIGAPGHAYTQWAAKMAVGLSTGVPWVMCRQDDVPEPIINTCNGYYCDWFSPNKWNKPTMWTENWSGWFTAFGSTVPHRPAEDIAFSVAKFIQKGGSFMNYYMYHGGTNFGRTAGVFISTSYDYDAPLDEFGLRREPKWGHLRDLHKAVKLCEPALVFSEPTVIRLGNLQEAHVFNYPKRGCAAFLTNNSTKSEATVTFRGMQYTLPPWSVSILPDCRNTVFNTAKVGSQYSRMKFKPVWQHFSWTSYKEEAAFYDEKAIKKGGLMEQINITRDASDYLWYSTDVKLDPGQRFLKNGRDPEITIESAGHALHVFINGQLSGTAYGGLEQPKLTFRGKVKLVAGVNRISLLSITVGLPSVGTHFERWNAGVLGPIVLTGLNEGNKLLTVQKWSYKVGLEGEKLGLSSVTGSNSVKWASGASIGVNQPMTWYKTTFKAIPGSDPLALDMGSMSKGLMWINGKSIGRYWPAYKASGTCGECYYAGEYTLDKCASSCKEASQRWYHVPRSWLNPNENYLVVFEEIGGNPNGISLVKKTKASVCGHISQDQPTLQSYLSMASGKSPLRPRADLWCSPGQKIRSIKFASYGTPLGRCGNYTEGSCHAHKSYDAFLKSCVGKQGCSVEVAPEVFGGDPCPTVNKKLAVEAYCV